MSDSDNLALCRPTATAYNLRSGARLGHRNGISRDTMAAAEVNVLVERMKALEMPDRLETFMDGMDARAWLNQFNILAAGKGWTGQAKLATALPLYWDKAIAAEWYLYLPEETKANFEVLSAAFLREFKPKAAQCWRLENTLRARQQQAGEPVGTFVKEVRREGQRIGLPPAEIVKIALNNLHPTARALIPGTPANIEEILDTPVGRGDVQATPVTGSSGGIDSEQYKELVAMLLKQNAHISSLEGKMEAAGTATGKPSRDYRQQYEPRRGRQLQQHQRGQQLQPDQGNCATCGGRCRDRYSCKAYGTVCTYCNGKNHWARVCLRRKADSDRQVHVNSQPDQYRSQQQHYRTQQYY